MPILAIAPEGTTSNGRCLLTFKRGAFVPGAPVVGGQARVRWPCRSMALPFLAVALHGSAANTAETCIGYMQGREA